MVHNIDNESEEKKDPFEDAFEKITEELSTDLSIDETDVEGELLRTNKLFTKWRNKLSIESMHLMTFTNKKATIYKELYLYFLKKAPDEVYKRKGAMPLVIPKSDLNTFIHADPDWINNQIRLEYQTQLVRFIENAMTRISSRQHELREIIKWRMFEAGEH